MTVRSIGSGWATQVANYDPVKHANLISDMTEIYQQLLRIPFASAHRVRAQSAMASAVSILSDLTGRDAEDVQVENETTIYAETGGK
jgi:hypothetical protein